MKRFSLGLAVVALAVSPCLAAPKDGAKPGGKVPTKKLFESPLVSAKTPGHAVDIDIDITGEKQLVLVVSDGGDGYGADWSDWAEPRLIGPAGEKKLTELQWNMAETGWGKVEINKNAKGDEMKIDGKAVAYGLGVHAVSVVGFELPPGYTRFKAHAGLDDGGVAQGIGSTVVFKVFNGKVPRGAELGQVADASHNPADAVESLDVADGLAAQLFASEPMITNPSNIAVDSRGRVWVCDVKNYRKHAGSRPEGDRILILEDTDGDGKADKCTTFYQGTDINSPHGVCVIDTPDGKGTRVIVSADGQIQVFTDTDGDGKSDKKVSLFTGISGAQHDHGIHQAMFGPDGKLYFNMGNAAGQINDKNGKPITDLEGNNVSEKGGAYRGGMVIRCNLDGSEVEVLGNNFRNNWMVTVDSFGTIWQSDNDDDGNRAVRINYVMQHGNYGYTDEVAGTAWQSPRVNIEKEIPQRHWHQNDPGVVPNLLITGAGAPCGIMVYEGDLLPAAFRGQMIHADAGANIIRAYPTEKDGAGYKATMLPILTGTRDKWFRPDDVKAAPDGSLIVADWYDPGVGGHGQADTERGRIFRVAPTTAAKYTSPKINVSTADGAIEALKSPNNAARQIGWMALHEMGDKAEPALIKLFASENPRFRARALWLLSKLEGSGLKHIIAALGDADADVRITALRATLETKFDVTPVIKQLLRDPSAAVRRECALSLRHGKSPDAAAMWAELAVQHDGKDRWYLEALGIGADKQWDVFLAAYMAKVGSSSCPGANDVIWRSRAKATSAALAKIIADPQTPAADLPHYFRAFNFQDSFHARPALVTLLGNTGPAREQIALMAINMLGNVDIHKDPAMKSAVLAAMDAARGTGDFVGLADRFNIRDKNDELLSIALAHPDEPAGGEAAKLLSKFGALNVFKPALDGADDKAATAAMASLVRSNDPAATQLVGDIAADAARPIPRASLAVSSLRHTERSQALLLQLVKDKKIRTELQAGAGDVLLTSFRADIRDEAGKLLPRRTAGGGKPLPPIAELAKRTGDAKNGEAVFSRSCIACHRAVGTVGIDFGPALTEIGDKFPKEGLYTSILEPSAAISFGFEGYLFKLKDGNEYLGYIVSQTGDEVTARLMGGITAKYKRSDIKSMTKQPLSLMTPGLAAAMSEQELVDLVEFLSTLKKKK